MATYKVTWHNTSTITGYIEADNEQDLINKIWNTTVVNEAGETVKGSPGSNAPWEMRETAYTQGIQKTVEISNGAEKTTGFPDPQ